MNTSIFQLLGQIGTLPLASLLLIIVALVCMLIYELRKALKYYDAQLVIINSRVQLMEDMRSDFKIMNSRLSTIEGILNKIVSVRVIVQDDS